MHQSGFLHYSVFMVSAKHHFVMAVYLCRVKRLTRKRNMVVSPSVIQVLEESQGMAESFRCPYVIPEHVLSILDKQEGFRRSLRESGYGPEGFSQAVESFLDSFVSISNCRDGRAQISRPLSWALEGAIDYAAERQDPMLSIPHVIYGIALLKDTLGGYLLRGKGSSLSRLIRHLDEQYS